MKTKIVYLVTVIFFCLYACKEEGRFEISSDDNVAPAPPTLRGTKPLNGGVRIFYKIPDDKDLLSIDAEYTNSLGKTFTYSSSYFKDSLDIYGFGEIREYTVKLYALDRAGNKSQTVDVTATPLEPMISLVSKSITVKPGFSSFYIDWENELAQSVNVYVDFDFTHNGNLQEHTLVFSSNLYRERRFIEDLPITSVEPIHARVRVEDLYGNITDPIDFGTFNLHEDMEIPKEKWKIPNVNDSIARVPQCFGNAQEGRNRYVIDGIIDELQLLNFMHTGHDKGRTGNSKDGNAPWNYIIDLGDYYELSRITTWQRHSANTNYEKGYYYSTPNVGLYNMYILDEETNQWEYLSTHYIPIPTGKSDIEIVQMGRAGDKAYMYPEELEYTKPTRWFRYEALNAFGSNYTSTDCSVLSEITLFGRKATK